MLLQQQQQHAASPLEQQLLERATSANFGGDGFGRMGMGHRRRQQTRSLYDLFPSEQLRQDLATRGAQTALMLEPGDPRLQHTPHTVQDFHTLFPLDANLEDHEVGSLACGSTKVYKAVSRADGSTVVLRRLEAAKVTQHFDAVRKAWMDLVHPNIVRLRNIFISNEWDGVSNSLTFAHDFIFGAMTLHERFMRPLSADMGDISEDLVWSYVAQLSSAMRFVHCRNKAFRCINAAKVLVTAQHRLYINGSAILDVVGDRKPNLVDLQAEDVRNLGTVLLQTICRSSDACLPHNLATSVDYVNAHYNPDLKQFIVFLITQPGGPTQATIFAASAHITGRLLELADHTYQQIDTCYTELSKELHNGRLFRLLAKLNMIVERPQPGTPAADSWSETGDRYLLKLFLDYVFHQVEEDARQPIVDLGSVVQCLNKLDVGVSEKVLLMSPDENTILVVSYADLKACCERSFMELLSSGNYSNNQLNRQYMQQQMSGSPFQQPMDWAGGGMGGFGSMGGGMGNLGAMNNMGAMNHLALAGGPDWSGSPLDASPSLGMGMGGVLASMGGVMGRNMMNANFQNAIHAPAFTPL